jgi:hypothetical protein
MGKLRAVIYARYSSEKWQDYSSIEDQISQGRILADRHVCDIVDIYDADAGISGESIWERPDMTRLMGDINKKSLMLLLPKHGRASLATKRTRITSKKDLLDGASR